MPAIRNQIRELRAKQEMTQQELADRVGELTPWRERRTQRFVDCRRLLVTTSSRARESGSKKARRHSLAR